jgi:D-aspartate ligase
VKSKVDRAGALVINADHAALGIVRSLGRHGIPVWVITKDRRHTLAAVSRYTQRHLVWPVADDARRLDYLLELGRRHGLDGWVIYPTDDSDAALLAHHETSLAQHFALTTPPWETMRWAYDKRLTYELAASLGVDHPWTYTPRGPEDLSSLDLTFPVILKPAVKTRHNRFTNARAWRAEGRRELLARYAEACKLVDPATVMVQELIPGGGEVQLSFAALSVGGHPLAWAVARRVRQYPVDFGRGSTFVESVDDPSVEEPARRLLTYMRYTGLVELEFKRDPRTGRTKLLDINPRIWGWHTLAGRAGVDFPYLSWRLARGEHLPATRARPGVRWVRRADIRAALTEIRHGRLSPAAYLGSLRPPLEFAVLALDDPMPALLDIPWRLLDVAAESLRRQAVQDQ